MVELLVLSVCSLLRVSEPTFSFPLNFQVDRHFKQTIRSCYGFKYITLHCVTSDNPGISSFMESRASDPLLKSDP